MDEQGDRPADHGSMVGDLTDRPSTDQPVTLEEAAARLGITVNAVRQRLKRGTLQGIKVADGWLVDIPRPSDHGHDRPPTDQPTRATNHRPTTTDHAPAVDLAPLAELIARQGDEIRRLTEAATVWQVRAIQAEDRLKQLTAGHVVGGDPAQDAHVAAGAGSGATAGPTRAPDTSAAAAAPEDARRSWWRRLLGW